jgi:hypothetical protein
MSMTMIVLSCALIATGFVWLAWSRRCITEWAKREILVVSSILVAGGLVLVVLYPQKPRLIYQDKEAREMCAGLAQRVEWEAVALGLYRDPEEPPSRLKEELRTESNVRAELLKEMAAEIVGNCVQTPIECHEIIAAARATHTPDFRWRLHYVADAMRDRGACQLPLPPPTGTWTQ